MNKLELIKLITNHSDNYIELEDINNLFNKKTNLEEILDFSNVKRNDPNILLEIYNIFTNLLDVYEIKLIKSKYETKLRIVILNSNASINIIDEEEDIKIFLNENNKIKELSNLIECKYLIDYIYELIKINIYLRKGNKIISFHEIRFFAKQKKKS